MAILDIVEQQIADKLVAEVEAAIDRRFDRKSRAVVARDEKLRCNPIPLNDWATVAEIDREAGVCTQVGVYAPRTPLRRGTGRFTYMRNSHKFALKLGQHISHELVYGRSREEILDMDLIDEATKFMLNLYINDSYGWWRSVIGEDVPWGLIVKDMLAVMRERIPAAYVKYAADLDYSPRRIKVDAEKFWDPTAEFDGREVLAIK